MIPLVAIVGRPNVGKSTLFNRLMRKRRAIVQDDPGVTRDRHYGLTRFADGREEREIELVDTGGFSPEARTGIDALVREQCQIAIDEADLVLLVMDARQGLLPTDRAVADMLRRTGKPVLHVANKVDGPKQDLLVGEFFELGVPQVLAVSAEHGRGVDELQQAILDALPQEADQPDAEQRVEDEVRVALVGRPNAGKSSLFNALVGENRAIVSAEPGTTRDPVDLRLSTDQGVFVLVDTAGIRRKRTKSTTMERYAIVRGLRSIGRADVACLIIDAHAGVTEQDAKLAALTVEAGRGLVLVLTKCDLLIPAGAAGRLPRRASKLLLEQVQDQLRFVSFAPVLFVSAVTRLGLDTLLPTAGRVHTSCGQRVGTAELNRFLEETVEAHAPPSHRGRPVRLYYVTQPQVHPPTFVVSTSAPRAIPEAYRRYIVGRLRERFGFEGAPLRLVLRQRGRGKD